jgi:peptidoglycan/LPS O-acetylase OafA/YrhL
MGTVKEKNSGSSSKPAKPLRDSNIELLRILAMIGIVMSHLMFSSPSGAALIAQHDHETFYLVLLQASGQIGVLLFFLITGYFMARKDFNFKSVTKLVSITWFYSLIFFLMALAVGAFGLTQLFNLDSAHTSLTVQNTLINLMPIVQNNYWFITTYIVILFLSPALNKILITASKRRLAMALIGITLAFFGLNYLSRYLGLGMTFEIYNNLLLYSLVYCIGAYLQLFPLKLKTPVIFGILGAALIAYFAWRYRLVFLQHSTEILNKDIDFPPFLIAISIFALFLRLKLPYNYFINLIAGTTLAVYLIHANRNVWESVWNVFDIYKVHGTIWFYFFPFVIGILVFAMCSAIELTRQYGASKLHGPKRTGRKHLNRVLAMGRESAG